MILTSGDRHQTDISVIDFDPKTFQGEPLGKIDHKILYICPKCLDKTLMPKTYQQCCFDKLRFPIRSTQQKTQPNNETTDV